MGTSAVRFAIIVVLVVGGVMLIDQAFPEGSADSLPRTSGSPSLSGSPSPTGTQQQQPPDGDKTTEPATKVVVGIYNGTSVTGLAGTTATQLSKKPGYRIPDAAVGDTPSKPVNETTIYYRTDEDEASAEALVTDFFAKRGLTDVKIERMQPDFDVPASLDLAIYLGTDFV